MKKIFSILAIATSLVMSSCEKWLDVNDNPNSADESVPTPDLRLPPVLAQFMDGYESAGTRTSLIIGQLAATGSSSNNYNLSRWYSTAASVAWPYQAWFVNCASNIAPMIQKAEETESYHYIGVGKIMYALGYLTLADLYGMLPYEEAFDASIMNPKYDDGSLIYEKALALLDEGILELQKAQGPAAISLAKGDYLFAGDVSKWIKFAYGIKARHLNHLSKTTEYNPDAILAALKLGPASNEESAIYAYQDEAISGNSATNSLQYQNNSATRLTKLYLDYINNNYTGAPSGNNNVQDPRYKLLAASYGILKLNPNGNTRYIDTVWTEGVNMATITGAGIATTETQYIQLLRSTVPMDIAKDTLGTKKFLGTWYTLKGSKGLLLTYAEMKFIEAEVQFKKGNRQEALAAYKAGIKSHIETMGLHADAYLNSTSVVQSAGVLTLSHIMIQKYIALSYSPELFSDMRRMNFCADASNQYNETTGIYKGYNRPGNVYTQEYPQTNMWPRRFAVASYSINFNLEQVLKQDPEAGSIGYLAKPIFWDK
ncbi:SusD/RagB family nutrient-binding outer membrane lipoprotein [Sphingobacterium rhinopitheci]|uniref:SusD/RagB family nutrient-binding outer membrane lipoprotein n=1 Tax=Sphingobacterium rhinopitheci TaxID=2781960 RepID=UPI001F51AD0B|nr:SusD/RagB family nutrient-binding outer membrane lipoprotein [Sphingobacterium rhinopitheci]MCI0920500.1 SusD/RagB family nutrient-binding outer membrane lipoprotein [Sphingobacterium rhinopitheci]